MGATTPPTGLRQPCSRQAAAPNSSTPGRHQAASRTPPRPRPPSTDAYRLSIWRMRPTSTDAYRLSIWRMKPTSTDAYRLSIWRMRPPSGRSRPPSTDAYRLSIWRMKPTSTDAYRLSIWRMRPAVCSCRAAATSIGTPGRDQRNGRSRPPRWHLAAADWQARVQRGSGVASQQAAPANHSFSKRRPLRPRTGPTS